MTDSPIFDKDITGLLVVDPYNDFISEGGKIAAFISLGVLLLIVSFMYQRLKKILLSDEAGATLNKTEETS